MRKLLFSNFKDYIRLLRITNWLKNIFVFVPLVFSKHLFDLAYIYDVLIGFIAFSFTSSLVYVFNDIFDAEKDRIHPLKKDRPIASMRISIKDAFITFFILLIIIGIFSIYLQKNFVLMLWFYILINIAYTLYLKKIVIADIFCIAAGFLLRVIAGAFIISVYLSNWLILTTIFLSLFLAVMKRRVEIASNPSAANQRTVLKDYSIDFINLISAITATCVIMSYALYTVAERTIKAFGSEELVFTTLFVIFGIFRYMFLAIKKNKGENVVELLLTDLPMLINILLFISVALYIIYF